MDKVFTRLSTHPKLLFLVDGLGAALSALMLLVVLVRLEPLFGMPIPMLHILGAIPIFFVIYDLVSYLVSSDKTRILLIVIAILNIAYCLLSVGIALQHKNSIQALGWVYLFVEIGIVLTLVHVELQIARRIKRQIL